MCLFSHMANIASYKVHEVKAFVASIVLIKSRETARCWKLRSKWLTSMLFEADPLCEHQLNNQDQ